MHSEGGLHDESLIAGQKCVQRLSLMGVTLIYLRSPGSEASNRDDDRTCLQVVAKKGFITIQTRD